MMNKKRAHNNTFLVFTKPLTEEKNLVCILQIL